MNHSQARMAVIGGVLLGIGGLVLGGLDVGPSWLALAAVIGGFVVFGVGLGYYILNPMRRQK